MRVFAVDIGIHNLSFAVVSVDEALPQSEQPRDRVAAGRELLARGTIEAWQVVSLVAPHLPSPRGSQGQVSRLLEAVGAFVLAHAETLRRCTALVLEQQMAPRMRVIAAALFAAARAHAPQLPIFFQSCTAKLDWGSAAPKAYRARKRLAVNLCKQFLDQAGARSAACSFEAAPKQDDLADALLHGLYFLTRAEHCTPARDPKRRRTQLESGL